MATLQSFSSLIMYNLILNTIKRMSYHEWGRNSFGATIIAAGRKMSGTAVFGTTSSLHWHLFFILLLVIAAITAAIRGDSVFTPDKSIIGLTNRRTVD